MTAAAVWASDGPSRAATGAQGVPQGSGDTRDAGKGKRASGGRTGDRTVGKLVRDRIPAICLANGQEPVTYIASPAEYRSRLVDKLGEEVTELTEAVTEADAEHVAEEAADVLEVVYAIAAHHDIDAEQLEKIRRAKALERGGFADRVIWVGNR